MTEPVCAACKQLSRQDALTLETHEIIGTVHNPCAPITHYTCRCKTCNAQWIALEVFDEDGVRPSEWSWEPA